LLRKLSRPISTTFPYTTLFRSIDRQDNFTLVGADARRGKLTLFSAEGPREQGAFKHVALRVSKLPGDTETDTDLGQGVRIRLVRSEEHTSELQSRSDLVCRLLL